MQVPSSKMFMILNPTTSAVFTYKKKRGRKIKIRKNKKCPHEFSARTNCLGETKNWLNGYPFDNVKNIKSVVFTE